MVAAYHKRKAGSNRRQRKPPFVAYAVAVGRQGMQVYQTSREFEASVIGYRGGKGKGFYCLKEARDWLSRFKCSRTVATTAAPFLPPRTSLKRNYDMDTAGDFTTSPVGVDPIAPPVQQAVEVAPTTDITTVSISGPPVQMPQVGRIPDAPGDYSVPRPIDRVGGSVENSDSKPALPQWRVKIGPDEAPTAWSKSATPTVQDRVAHFGTNFSAEQKEILKVVNDGKSIFFTGAAGTGKSVTLRAVIKMLRDKYGTRNEALAVTASTGIAALNVGGETLHSFAGIGLGKKPLEDLLEMLKGHKKARKRWKVLETLIIDEISMVEGTFFDKLEAISRDIRRIPAPFGGIQVVICGDFFQLPPVPDQYQGAPVPVCFAFDASSWGRCIKLQMRLTQVFRQSDSEFVNILNQMRVGRVDPDLVERIRHLERSIEYNGIEPVQIYPRNFQVEDANARRLKELSGGVFTNTAVDCGRWINWDKDDISVHRERIANLLHKYSIAPRSIKLKEGAQVMLIRNLVQGQLVNGTLGRVVCFASVQEARKQGIRNVTEVLERSLEAQAKSNQASLDELRRLRRVPTEIPDIAWPLVEFTNSQRVLFTPLPFDMEDAFGDLEATRAQVPLILAWAITVHKSQGQTIERLRVDFAGTFENGQAYVAMSRATSMETLQILNFKPMMIRAHPRVLEWYKSLIVEAEMDNEEAVKAYFSHF